MRKSIVITIAAISLTGLSFSSAALAAGNLGNSSFAIKATTANPNGEDFTAFAGSLKKGNTGTNPSPGGNEDGEGNEEPPKNEDTVAPTATVTLTDAGPFRATGMVSFSEEVTGFDASSLRLELYNSANATIESVIPISPTDFMITISGNLEELSKFTVLSLDLTSIKDLAGNPGVGTAQSVRG